MKKLLSIVLALSLCLTAMMGCFVVSAETTVPSIKIADVKAAPGAVAIAVTGENFKDVCAADLVITLEEGLTFVSLTKDGELLEGNLEAEDGVDYVINGQSIRYLDIFNGFDGYSTTTLNLVINATAAADGEYDVTATIVAADYDEEFINGIEIDAGVVTIKTPCAHAEFTYTNNGDNHTKACKANCGEFEAVVEDHVYGEDNKCVCGAEKVVEPAEPTPLSLHYEHSLNLQSKILINNYVLVTDELDSCAAVYMDCTKSTPTGEKTVTLSSVRQKVGQLYYYWFQYDDIAAAELGLTFSSYVYGVDAEGTVLYESDELHYYSALNYLGDKMADNSGKISAAQKTLFADIVNYATAAQINFNYNTKSLAKDDERVASLVTTYQSSQDAITDLDFEKDEVGEGFKGIQNSLALESSVKLSFAWLKSETKNYDASTLRVVLNYNGKTKEYLASQIESYNANYDCVYFDGLGAPEFEDIVTFTLYSGDTAISATETYSIESFCADRYNRYNGLTSGSCTEELYNLTQALMRYSRAAQAVFG